MDAFGDTYEVSETVVLAESRTATTPSGRGSPVVRWQKGLSHLWLLLLLLPCYRAHRASRKPPLVAS